MGVGEGGRGVGLGEGRGGGHDYLRFRLAGGTSPCQGLARLGLGDRVATSTRGNAFIRYPVKPLWSQTLLACHLEDANA